MHTQVGDGSVGGLESSGRHGELEMEEHRCRLGREWVKNEDVVKEGPNGASNKTQKESDT